MSDPSEPLASSNPAPPHRLRGRLTTHVLDTAHGIPAAGMQIALYRQAPASADVAGGTEVAPWLLLRSAVTNADGRLNEPLLQGDDFQPGLYRLMFDVEAYFRDTGDTLSQPAFLGRVPLDFGLADVHAHYHVPLLVSPWSYSTYRGS